MASSLPCQSTLATDAVYSQGIRIYMMTSHIEARGPREPCGAAPEGVVQPRVQRVPLLEEQRAPGPAWRPASEIRWFCQIEDALSGESVRLRRTHTDRMNPRGDDIIAAGAEPPAGSMDVSEPHAGLKASLKAGTVSVALEFGGQGYAYLAELREACATGAALDLLEAVGAALVEEAACPEAVAARLFDLHGLDVVAWVASAHTTTQNAHT